ncbi:RDD family protein [Actinomadura sp. ATCC 31491]|uniref:RDD family protein n=1 Tax=Actinomadura luzonensis TaxID=2805427 RepID=A0ABT0FNV9_9ACTN|nr:RDD family protein [Actinomadura luzonensis]MCK2213944.1 RDD family protein [Actinomadura luzonensis]
MAGTAPRADTRPAEWWERLGARLIEGLVFGVIYYILFITLWGVFRTVGVLEAFGGRLPGMGAWLAAGAAYTGYDWWAHSRGGRTFGKTIMRIHLVPDEPAPGAALKRALVYPGPLMLVGIPVVNLLAGMLLFGVGLLILIDKPLERGPHDRLAGTRVVKDLR